MAEEEMKTEGGRQNKRIRILRGLGVRGVEMRRKRQGQKT